jgi:hypothetical protein
MGPGLGDGRAQFGPQLLHRRSDRRNRAIGGICLVNVAFAFERIGAEDRATDRGPIASALLASSAAWSS